MPKPITARAFEDLFVDAIQATGPITAHSIRNYLQWAPGDRLNVYRTGYYARLTETYAKTVFERAVILVGEDLIHALLASFFEQRPPTAPVLQLALDGFVQFVREKHCDHIKGSPYLPDFLELCIGWDRCLAGPDPAPDLSQLIDIDWTDAEQLRHVRVTPHLLQLSSSFPIFSLWRASDPASKESVVVSNEPERTWVYKSSCYQQEIVRISASLWSLADLLRGGISLLEALERAPEPGPEPEDIQALFTHLARTHALVVQPRPRIFDAD